MTDESEPGIQRRFRDLGVDVTEERAIRYVVRQLRFGRHIDEVLTDPYLTSRLGEVARDSILQHPTVIKALEQEIRQQFADYSSMTRREAEEPQVPAEE